MSSFTNGVEERKESGSLGCCDRLRREFKGSMFEVIEPQDENKIIDIAKTFQPASLFGKIIKVVFALFGIAGLVETTASTDHPAFMWAYLSNWSFLIAVVYLTLSAVLSFMTEINQDTLLVKVTWFLYPLAASTQIIVFLLFWSLDFEKDQDIVMATIAAHGLLMLLVLVDGVFLSRIPVRFRQFLGTFGYFLVYLLWTVVHFATNMGNPSRDDTDGKDPDDDDSIYPVLSWKNKPVQALIICLAVLFILTPLVFLLVWIMSAVGQRGCCNLDGSRRRYMELADHEERTARFD